MLAQWVEPTRCWPEDKFGSLEVGKYTDFVIVNQNLFEIPAERISESILLVTMFVGETVNANDSAIDNLSMKLLSQAR